MILTGNILKYKVVQAFFVFVCFRLNIWHKTITQLVLIASLEIVCFFLIILDRGGKQQWFFYQMFHEIQASILQHGNRFSGWFKRIGARATTGLSLKVSPTSELRKLNVLSKSQQEHRDSSAGAREPETILQANIFCVRMVLSSWLGAEKEIRRVVRGENGLAAGVLVLYLLTSRDTGYINKNSYGRDCIHLIIICEREKERDIVSTFHVILLPL